MKILVIGAGTIGQAIVGSLYEEGHEVTIMDKTESKLSKVTEKYDVMGMVGNATDSSDLKLAGIDDTDLVISVTQSDEINILACLIAKKIADCKTVARIKDYKLNREARKLKEELGLSLVINPERATARAIARMLKYPSAMQVETFAKGRVELSRVKLEEDNILCDTALKDINHKLKCEALIVMVQRDEHVIIPDGSFILKAGDIISFMASPANILKVFKKISPSTKVAKKVMIVGGSQTAIILTKLLVPTGMHVTIIERDPVKADLLSKDLPDARIILGDATENEILEEEGIADCDAFVTLTEYDEENIMLSLHAKTESNAKCVTRIHRQSYSKLIKELDLDSVVYPRLQTAENLIQFVRAMENSKEESNIETLYRLADGKVEALEFWIKDNCPLIGIPFYKIQTKDNLLIASIYRDGKAIVPTGSSTIEKGDSVVVITTHKGLKDIKDVLK